MGTNSADVQEKQLKAQAKETRRQAGIYQKEGMKEAVDMTTESNASMSQALALLGKAGALGVSSKAVDYSAIDSGVDTGSLEGKSMEDLKDKIADREKKFDIETVVDEETGEEKKSVKYNVGSIRLYRDIKDQKQDKEDLANLQTGLDEIGDVSAGDTANLTMGSTALNLKTFQDKLTKARNKYVNQVQEDVYSALMSAENADAQANLAAKASNWQTFNNILSIGTSAIKIAGMF